MKDIRRPSRNLRYNQGNTTGIPVVRISEDKSEVRQRVTRPMGMGVTRPVKNVTRSHVEEVTKKVEEYENGDYIEEQDYNDYTTEDTQSSIVPVRRKDASSYYSARDRVLNSSRGSSISDWYNKYSKLLYLLGVLAIAFLLMTFVFNSATINVVPKQLDKKIKADYVISNTDDAKKVFEIMSFDNTVERDLPKNSKQKVVSKASGELTIFNNFDANPQKLIKNTRFESKDGKIFRVTDTITVPGKSGDNPGKVTARVTADSTGDSYNIGAGKWTIPGFKGSARYDGFYAESYSAMSGGSNSEKMIIAKEDVDRAVLEMTAEAKDLIKKDIDANVKLGYSIVKDDIVYDIKNNLSDFESGKDDKFKLFANAKLLSINKDNMADYLMQKEDTAYTGEDVTIKNFDDMRIKYDLTKNKGIDLITATSVNLSIEGLPTFVYKVDSTALKMDLLGKKNSDEMFNSVLSKYVSIASAKSKISPFWVNSYPSSANKIKVLVEQ